MSLVNPPKTNQPELDIWLEMLTEYVRTLLKGKMLEVVAFTANDATPDVGDGNFFKTANTSATTITALDGGANGQTVHIIIGDANTTIDFTGTNLRGNSGVDWTPTTNDHMTCIKDDTNWFCTISNN